MMKPSRSLSFDSFVRLGRVFFGLTTLIAIALYAYLATRVRLAGDDYCISARLIGFDPLTASLIKYWTISNRFSNQFVAWFSDGFGMYGPAVLAVLSLTLWWIGLMWLFYEIHRLTGRKWEPWAGLGLAGSVIVLSLYTAPNLYQATQWRPGLMTYLLPLVLDTLTLAWIFHLARQPENTAQSPARARWILGGQITLLFLAAFFAGGLSETVGALYITLLALTWLGTFFMSPALSRKMRLLLTAALAGALLAMTGMFLSPANAIRLNDAPPPPIPVAIGRAFGYVFSFLLEVLKVSPVPIIVALSLGTIFGYLGVQETNRSRWSHLIGWGWVVLPGVVYVLIAASFAPSAYGQSYPVARARFPAQVMVMLTLVAEGYWLGVLVSRRRLPAWTRWVAGMALLLLAMYPLWISRNTLKIVPMYQEYAAQWDARHAQIRQQAAAGQQTIAVQALPALGGIDDLRMNPRHWTNFCAAIYYGVDSIVVEGSP